MPYSTEDLDDIAKKYAFWHGREDELTTSLLVHVYRTDAAYTMVKHGLVRRFHTLCHCMNRTFQHVAPDEKEPVPDALLDASVYLQAFVVNVYGTLDNLARIWVVESDLQEKGKPVPRGHIGLGPKFVTVRKSLSKEFQEYLTQSDGWFKYLENYRHALAHRIPLYIPPYRIDAEAETKWRELDLQMEIATKEHRHELWNELLAKQKKLGVFEPLMMHSFGNEPDDGYPIHFHGQMICDLAKVIDISELMLEELEAIPKGNVAEAAV